VVQLVALTGAGAVKPAKNTTDAAIIFQQRRIG
jgi:hypothetical protein